ncbi:MAG: porin [Candidatus Eremiobacteraeota bacterium]|nr:porin [Candidatus Eremiobacteraeota bacterium]
MRSVRIIQAALLAATLGVSRHTLGAQMTTDSVARDTAPKVTFGAFVDGYYAYDFDRPPTIDRSFAGGALFTTQPARHNEFNINLAFGEVKLEAPHYHGRLAVQFGTSVQSNYIGEPRIGQISGPSVEQYLQEAYAGVKLGKRVWVDAGIFGSNLGMESFISRDNLTYTRALVSEYSPYFSTGVRAMYTVTPTLTARLDVVNGWQNFSENNSGKGVGIRLDYTPIAGTTLSYYNMFSDETGSRLRTFNSVGVKRSTGPLAVIVEGDLGTQVRPAGSSGSSTWYGLLGVARVRVTPVIAIAGRVERYNDPDQVVLSTGTRTLTTYPPGGSGVTTTIANPAFRGNSASLGVDVQPYQRVLFRTELRGFHNADPVFPNGHTGVPRTGDGFVVSSLAVTF